MASFKAETSRDGPKKSENFFFVRIRFYPTRAWEFPKK